MDGFNTELSSGPIGNGNIDRVVDALISQLDTFIAVGAISRKEGRAALDRFWNRWNSTPRESPLTPSAEDDPATLGSGSIRRHQKDAVLEWRQEPSGNNESLTEYGNVDDLDKFALGRRAPGRPNKKGAAAKRALVPTKTKPPPPPLEDDLIKFGDDDDAVRDVKQIPVIRPHHELAMLESGGLDGLDAPDAADATDTLDDAPAKVQDAEPSVPLSIRPSLNKASANNTPSTKTGGGGPGGGSVPPLPPPEFKIPMSDEARRRQGWRQIGLIPEGRLDAWEVANQTPESAALYKAFNEGNWPMQEEEVVERQEPRLQYGPAADKDGPWPHGNDDPILSALTGPEPLTSPSTVSHTSLASGDAYRVPVPPAKRPKASSKKPPAPAANAPAPAANSQAPAAGSKASAAGSKAPAAGSKASAAGSKAPAANSQVPAAGSKASAAGSKAPAASSKAPATSSKASAAGPKAPVAGPKASAAGSKTPTTNSQAPEADQPGPPDSRAPLTILRREPAKHAPPASGKQSTGKEHSQTKSVSTNKPSLDRDGTSTIVTDAPEPNRFSGFDTTTPYAKFDSHDRYNPFSFNDPQDRYDNYGRNNRYGNEDHHNHFDDHDRHGRYDNYDRHGRYDNGDRNNGYGHSRNNGYDNNQYEGYDGAQNDGYDNNQYGGYGNEQNDGYDNGQNGGYGNDQTDGYGNGRNGGYNNGQNGGYNNAQNDSFDNAQNGGFDNYHNNRFSNTQNNGADEPQHDESTKPQNPGFDNTQHDELKSTGGPNAVPDKTPEPLAWRARKNSTATGSQPVEGKPHRVDRATIICPYWLTGKKLCANIECRYGYAHELLPGAKQERLECWYWREQGLCRKNSCLFEHYRTLHRRCTPPRSKKYGRKYEYEDEDDSMDGGNNNWRYRGPNKAKEDFNDDYNP